MELQRTQHKIIGCPATRALAAFLLLSAWLLGWASASAQAFPPLNGIVSDDTGRLDTAAINQAAKQLQDLGVKPLIVLSQSGRGYADAPQLAQAAAQQYGLASGSNALDPNLLAIVVILDSRRSTLLYGDALVPPLNQTSDQGTVADKVRTSYLNPNLAAGDYNKAFTSAIGYTAGQISNYRNPPPTATPVPSVINNVDTSGIGSALVWIVGGIALLIALFIIVPLVWRQYRKGQEAAGRLRTLREQLLQARNVAADMITNLEFPGDPNEQIQYRFLALALANERPQQLANITGQYKALYARLSDALARYNALNERQPNTEQELTTGIAEYQQVQATVKEASDFLQKLDEMGKGVQTQVNSAPGEADSAKKAIAAATDELARLAAAAPDLKLAPAEQVLASASQSLAQAQQALQTKPPRPLQAYDAAQKARADTEAMRASIRSIEQLYTQLGQGRAKLANSRREGFRLAQADADFADALSRISVAAAKLPSGGKALSEALQQATQAVQRAAANIDAAIAQHAANGKALAALKVAGEQLKQYIQQGAVAFDAVDEYAPSTWADIQGNGTEAQKRADAAYALWQQATQLNDSGPQGEQDFAGAARLIEEANAAIQQGQALVAAIIDRLKNLQESQRTARDEITAADKSLAEGRAFVQQYDPDITPEPAAMLDAAQRQLQQAKQEIAQAKPDWIKAVQMARSANDAADKALADARSQEAAIEALRQRVQTTGQQAAAGISRAQNFVQVHKSDITDRAALSKMAEAQSSLQKAQTTLQQLQRGSVEDLARANLLTTAVNQLTQAQQAADAAYTLAYNQFQAMDTLRRQTAEIMQRAQAAIDQATTYVRDSGNALSEAPISDLREALALMPRWQDGANAATLMSFQEAAARAQAKAESAMQAASADVQEYNSRLQAQQSAANAARAAALLALFASSGSGRHGGHGGGWGGGWGSSGGHGGGGGGGIFGGGGGSSSGGWGGGGSSGGSFGGGGSSGGGWGGGGSSSGGW